MAIKVNFRVATEADASQLHQLVESAFRAEDSREGWTDDLGLSSSFRIDPNEILAMITKSDSVMLMAMSDHNTLVGSIGAARHQQQGGIGSLILTYAEDYCRRTWDVTTLGLNALSNRRQLISWYSRHGYRETGETTPFPCDQFESLALPADLCFVEFEKILGSS
ncbi:hypothetical protein N7475_000468 [Penicillium sp. IBT 31633x]|nr:hypothetical protein N7475_000468 [Penicillium sp. IBT 31633x]